MTRSTYDQSVISQWRPVLVYMGYAQIMANKLHSVA